MIPPRWPSAFRALLIRFIDPFSGDSVASSCPAQQWTASAGDCAAAAKIYNSELPPYHHTPSPHPPVTSFRPPHHLPSKIHQQTLNNCDCDQFSCQSLSTEPLEPSSGDAAALKKPPDLHDDAGNDGQSGQLDSLPRSCESYCSSSSSSSRSTCNRSCNSSCHSRQQYNRETNGWFFS